MEQNDTDEQFTGRILEILMRYEGVDLQRVKTDLALVMKDYTVSPKETALVIYTEGKNTLLIRDFLLAKIVAGRTKGTIQTYREILTMAFMQIGKDADTIKAADIQALFAKMLRRGCSKSYCNHTYLVMRSFYTWAFNYRRVPENPTLLLEKMHYIKPKEAAFSQLEIEKMRERIQTNRDRALFELLLSTGCRASEICHIKIEDIRDDQIVVLGKGEKYRTVYVNAKAQVALSSYLPERHDKNPYLFPRMKNKNELLTSSKRHKRRNWYQYPEYVDEAEPMNTETINYIVKHIAKLANVDGCHTHRFRRTCATMALRRGMPLEQVSMMLGHEQIGTTQIYLDIREDDLKASHNRYVNI